MKKIGILGSGNVGKALAAGLVKHGYEVMVSSRSKTKYDQLKKETGASAGSPEEAASFGDAVIVAVSGGAAEGVVSSLAGKLAGKTVIDVTNPIDNRPPANGVLHFFTSLDESLLERLQKKAPAAHLVKAFNTVGSSNMIDPEYEVKPTMFICGNNDRAKKDVSGLLEKVGWEVEDMGTVEAARAIEPLCMLYCIPGILQDRWTHAFKLLKK